eukprot:4989571-Prymnesium_polylepis.1
MEFTLQPINLKHSTHSYSAPWVGPIAHGCAKAFVPVCAYGSVTWNFAADDACDLFVLQNLRSFTVLILTRSE